MIPVSKKITGIVATMLILHPLFVFAQANGQFSEWESQKKQNQKTPPAYQQKNDLTIPTKKIPEALKAPRQASPPKNISNIKGLTCVFNRSITNPSFTCIYQGKTYDFPKYNSITDNWYDTNVDFEDIRYFYELSDPPGTNIPIDITTMKVGFSRPRFHMDYLREQIKEGFVRMPNGDPISMLHFEVGGQGYGSVVSFLRIEGVTSTFEFPRILEYSLPNKPLNNLRGNNKTIPGFILQPEKPSATSPKTIPTPSDGAFGGPVGGISPVKQTPHIGIDNTIGPLSNFWNVNINGGISLYHEFPILEGGIKRISRVPMPGISKDGKALNFYIFRNGLYYTHSFTDLNNDGVYEAHIVKLLFDPNSGLLSIDYNIPPFQSEAAFLEYSKTHQLKSINSK